MTLTFTKATKKAAKGRICLDGPSGSGKTYTALTMATTLGGRIAVIDTEHGSASKYADIFDFDALNLGSFRPQLLIEALGAAAAGGYDVVIVDSLSHFWMGTEGMLEQVDRAAKRAGGHGMSGWKEMRPEERQMVEAILGYPGHLICTLRVKTDWVEGENARGKRVMQKVGTKAEQREGLEYEFDLVASMDLSNELTVVKSRCPALSGEIIAKPGAAFAQKFKTWLEDGEAAGPSKREQLLEQIGAAQDREQFSAAINACGDAERLGQINPVDVAMLKAAIGARKAKLAGEEPKNPGNDPQRRKMMALFSDAAKAAPEAGFDDRDNRLSYISDAIGRKVSTSNDLSDDDVQAVNAKLTRFIDLNDPSEDQANGGDWSAPQGAQAAAAVGA